MYEDKLIPFLLGTGPDSQGRRHADILDFSDEELEDTHDAIQWLFPLREKSMFAPDSPVLDDEMVRSLRGDARVRERMLQALERMKRFYGDNDHWLEQGNHNHLRITRILKSACLMGLRQEARDFHTFVLQRVATAQPVTNQSLTHWHNSISEK